jgi:uncharacterized coiled-coil DUF342 family protein
LEKSDRYGGKKTVKKRGTFMDDYVTKKDFDKFNQEIREEFRRHTGILLEEFQKNIGFVIDQQQDIRRDISELKQKTDRLENKADMIHSELIAHRDNTEIHAVQVTRKRK